METDTPCFMNSPAAQEHKLSSTRADRSPILESMARHLEDHLTADAYQACCIMCEGGIVALSGANVATGAAPHPGYNTSSNTEQPQPKHIAPDRSGQAVSI